MTAKLSACGTYTWNTAAAEAAERYAAAYGVSMDEMREWFRNTPRAEWGDLIEYLEREYWRS